MNTKLQLTLLNIGILATILLPSSSAPAFETSGIRPAYYLAEHGDLDIGFEDGRLDLHVHVHAGGIVDGNALAEDTAFEPEDVIIVGAGVTKTLRPSGASWSPVGVDANAPMWILPQHEKEGLPMFGLATEDIEPGLFVNDTITLTLRRVKGPGHFSLWSDDAFGQPAFQLSTHDSLLTASMPVGLHGHENWGFTQPGLYILVIEVSGDLVTGGRTDALAIYTFLISESPVPLQPLAGDVNRDGAVNELDLAVVQGSLGQTVPVWPPEEHDLVD
jgi:surface-anchored protein